MALAEPRGAVLLEAKRPSEAETVYWEDLKRNRENGWALFGLMQALKAQGKMTPPHLSRHPSKRPARARILR